MLAFCLLVPLSGCQEEAAEEAEQTFSPSQAEAEALKALGYVAWTDAVSDAVGVTQHDPERAFEGLSLVLTGSGPQAMLMDMSGEALHTWSYDSSLHYEIQEGRNYWVNAHLMDNGDLLAISDPHGMIKLDKDSGLIWATDASRMMHHDLFVTDDNLIYVLGKRLGKRPEIDDESTFIQDLVIVLDAAGNRIREFSILDAYLKSPFGDELVELIRNGKTAKQNRERGEDKPIEDLHTNTLEVFDGSQADKFPLLKKGNMLFASPTRNAVFIIDGETETVVWNWFGPWQGIHRPIILDGETFILFHNVNHGRKPKVPVASEVVEYDLSTRELVWSYGGDPENAETHFYSGYGSQAYRLPNGNSLMIVSGEGRAIEVTQEGEKVWEYVTPDRSGRDADMVATLFLSKRLPLDTPLDWRSH